MHKHVDGDFPAGDPGERIRGSRTRWVVLGILAALILAFVLQNRDRANVDFLFWDADVRIWFALLIAAVLGFLAGMLVGPITRGPRQG